LLHKPISRNVESRNSAFFKGDFAEHRHADEKMKCEVYDEIPVTAQKLPVY
jgi:hypothetical protein